jgi:hypothetical protein
LAAAIAAIAAILFLELVPQTTKAHRTGSKARENVKAFGVMGMMY